MSTNPPPNNHQRRWRTFRDERTLHFDVIAHSIGVIVERSQNADVKEDAKKVLGVTTRNSKVIKRELVKLMNKNYPTEGQQNQHTLSTPADHTV